MKSDDLNFQHHIINEKKYLNPKAGIVLIFLIVLQFSLSLFVFSAMGMDYVDNFYLQAIISYTIIVSSLIFFNPNILELFRDHFTLWTIVIGCFLPIVFGGESIIYKGILSILGIILVIYIIVNRKNIKFPSVTSILIGLGWSIVAVLIIALVYAWLDQTHTKPFPSNLSIVIASAFINQLSFTSVPEEAAFRGLIFSFMVANGYKEDKAFAVQALLFWFIHLGTIKTNPTLFFIIIPLGTLFMTLVIRKYKMLYLSIMMHTFINVFTTILVNLINRYLF